MAGAARALQAISRRTVQRRETRERVFEAALAEIARSGLAAADVGAIAAAAGVARGTFYFHFPTKEHVLAELERREELRIVAGLERRAVSEGDLPALLTAVVRQVRAAERRLGPSLFRDMLSIHFGATSPDGSRLDEHPVAVFIIEAARDALRAGRIASDRDPNDVAVIFLTGLFALLATRGGPSRVRDALLDTYVGTILQGVVKS
ncbi:MAG TPA: TetR/AcrR family transcriptional regulator [Candidatus Binatia bacterium]|nr:TetR/AcrR family transcriptional regulator [Candidatus Binatia bacterium]